MLPELLAIEPQLKQILYGCVEYIQATKAALYLPVAHDLADRSFELVTSYQFHDAERRQLNMTDDLVDMLAVKRLPFFVNGLTAEQRLSEMMFRQGTDRLLAAPIFARGRLIGFIDMRDKAGKRPFEQKDLESGKRIADNVVNLLSEAELFGLATIPVPDESQQKRITPAMVDPIAKEQRFGVIDDVPAAGGAGPHAIAATFAPQPPVSPAPTPAAGLRSPVSEQALHAIASARQTLSQQKAVTGVGKRTLTDYDLEVIRLLLPAALAIPGAVLACFSALGRPGAAQPIVALATLTEDAIEMLQQHLDSWRKRSHQQQVDLNPQLIYPFGVQVVPITSAAISSILSAPVNPYSAEGLTLTVGFERTPEAQAQRALQIFLRQIEHSVESAIAATSDRNDRQIIAEKLLEPDFQKYPDLVAHSRDVAALAARFASTLDLPPSQVETIRTAAFLHDVGLRLIDYERLHRKSNLTPDEMRAIAEHPVIGAALVEPIFGSEVAQAVLRHHERVDGKGYPGRLTGKQIPPTSRILQLADAWVAMTSGTYQPALSRQDAIVRIREGAGTQFDEALAIRFLQLMVSAKG